MIFILFILLFQYSAVAEQLVFPAPPVEHVGNGESDILHCKLEGTNRQFCKVGWGPAFKDLEIINIYAPESYGTELLIPESTETPFGFMTSKRVVERLQGGLWKPWRIAPVLNFVLDWSEDPACWKGGVRNYRIQVVAKGIVIGFVQPGLRNYQFPLTTPLDERVWSAVSTTDANQNRVKWQTPDMDRAVFTEFDFVDEATRSSQPFSNQVVPKKCKIIISNVQTVLNREAVDRAVETMEAKAVALVDAMTTETLLYAAKIQGKDGVRCVIANQLESLRKAEKIPDSANSQNLSERAKESLISALYATSNLTQYDPAEDAITFLDSHYAEWSHACVDQAELGLDQLKAIPAGAQPEIELLVTKFMGQKEVLQDLLEDAWSLAVLLKLVNDDDRKLQWMIDTTIKYRLTTKGAAQ